MLRPYTKYDPPKQLEIRNTPDGMIWQVYHVKDNVEATILIANSLKNGFTGHKLVNDCNLEETWPGWRDGEYKESFTKQYDEIRKNYYV